MATRPFHSIPLSQDVIRAYGYLNNWNPCSEISYIHGTTTTARGHEAVEVHARIPASSTNKRQYETTNVVVCPHGSGIYGTSCTCPVGGRCKHIYKVLRRISQSQGGHLPIPGPDLHHIAAQVREDRRAKQIERGALVYVVFACKAENDSGKDYRRSMLDTKDSFHQQTLGVFFTSMNAVQCAREYVEDDLEEETYDDDDLHFKDDESEFYWDNKDNGKSEFDKVWIERLAIEDAPPNFQKY